MEKCCRCKREFTANVSVVIVSTTADTVKLSHFFCATPAEVRALYGRPAARRVGGPNE